MYVEMSNEHRHDDRDDDRGVDHRYAGRGQRYAVVFVDHGLAESQIVDNLHPDKRSDPDLAWTRGLPRPHLFRIAGDLNEADRAARTAPHPAVRPGGWVCNGACPATLCRCGCTRARPVLDKHWQ